MRRAFLLPALLAPLLLGAASTPRADDAGSCIDADRIVSRRAVPPDTIEFTLPRGQIYRNRLAQVCPHLSELDRTYVIEFEHRNGQRVCGGDRFRLVDPIAARSGGGAGFPFCRFGAFQRVSHLPRADAD